MNINRKIQEYLNKYKSRKRKFSFMALLSFMVALTVVMSLVTPAISMTIENSPLAAVGLLGVLGENSEKREGEPSFQADVSGVQNIADADTHNVSLSIDANPVTPDTEFDSDSVNLEFNLDYTFNANSDKSRFNLDNDKYNLYFEISGIDNPTFILDNDSKRSTVSDTKYYAETGNDKAGEFEIIGNFICIKFTDEYKQYLLSETNDGSLIGSLTFSGEVSRSESEDGDKKIIVAGEEITVKFKDKFPEVSKEQGNVNSDGTVSWTVNIKSNGADLSQYNVSDILSYNGSNNIIPTISDVNPSGIYNDGQWSLSGTNDITITYKTKITDEQLKAGTINNKFSIRKNDSEKEISENNNAYLSNPFDITKTGTADYSDYENGKIKWEINIKNNYGVNLDGYILNEIINNADIGSMTVTQPTGGQITSMDNGDWKLSNVGSANNIIITYETDAESGKTYNNTAKLKYPDGTPTGDEAPKSVKYESESNLIKLDKKGEYNANDHKIKWTVTVTAENGYNFKDYKITDEKFTDNVNIKYFKNNHSVNGGNYAAKEGNAYIINDAAGDIDKVVFEYETDVPAEDIVKGTTVANSVGGGPGTSTVATATANINVTARSTAQKNLKCSPLATTVVGSAGVPTQTLSWEALLTLDDKFAGKTYEDKPSATNGAEHTADTNSIKVMASHDGTSYELVNSSEYEINSADGGFTLKFKDDFDSQNYYNFVKITYDTKATIGSDYVNYEFKNNGKFGENGNIGPVSGGNITRKDANQTMTLNVSKNWSSNVDTKPDSVTFKLKYSTDNGKTWNYVKQNGDKFIYNTDSDYNSSNDYTVEIKSNNNQWNSTISGLRQSQEINGTVVQYQYQLEEYKFGDSSVNGDTFETDDGIYTVTYGGNGNYVYATNTLKKFINITAKKEWDGKTGSNVKVRLEYRMEQDWTWRPVKINSNEYIVDPNNSDAGLPEVTAELGSGSSWEHKFEKLPDKYNNTNIYYRIVEIECDGKAVDNNRIIFDDGYYDVTYSNNEINSSGTVTVTNKFVQTENTSISITKEWGSEDIKSKFDSVTVQLLQNGEAYGNSVILSSVNNWSYTWENVPNQEIVNGQLTVYTYDVSEIAFKEKGKESVVIKGDRYMDSEGQVYNWVHSGNAADGYKITNSAIFENTEIALSKEWSGDSGWNGTDENGVEFKDNNRPKELEFVLERKLLTDENWTEVKGTVDASGNVTIDDSGNPVTVSLTSENAVSDTLWNGTALKNLPKYKYIRNEDGSISWNEMAYRFRETAYTDKDGNKKDIPADAKSFEVSEGKYSISYEGNKIKNTFKKDVGITKTALDGNGKPIPNQTLESTDLSRKEDCPYYAVIDNEEYYVFNWQIKYLLKDWNGGDKLPTVEDKLPDGFTLCTYDKLKDNQTLIDDSNYWLEGQGENIKNSEEALGYYGKKYYPTPILTWIDKFSCLGRPADTSDEIFEKYMLGIAQDPNLRYYYDTDTNTVYFNKYNATSEARIQYSIKIPCDDLEEKLKKGNYSIINQAFTYGDESANPADRKPTGETEGTLTIKAPSNLLVKDYKKSLIPGYVQYTLDVNPEGKNLSNGNTIDIRDIFDTDSYTDTCHNKVTEGSKLVDILMTRLKLYKVNENGVRTELKQNEYTMKFASGKSTNDGAALLELSIPDEMHIEIQYTYKIIANENTPSVLNGCKSSVVVNGKLDKMKPGYVPPTGHEIAFHNRAKLISDSATAEDTKRDDKYRISRSSGTVSTNSRPKIKKVNVGNYSINSLDATFLMAKYENGLWYFAKSVDAQNGGAITWSETGMQGSKIDENAGDINVKPAKEVAIEQDILYKLVEVSVPKGYEGSNLIPNDENGEKFRQLIIDYLNNGTTILDGTDYSKFLTNYVSTHYFAYNSNISSVQTPNNVSESDIIQVKSGDDIEIPNSKLIDIGISKEWYGDDNANHDNDSVTVELYWSYEKTASGMPDNAIPADADDLGIMDSSFTSVKSIKISELNGNIWNNLPNGKNSKPVYYYVKETSYTVNGTTYTLDEKSGKFLSGSENGSYLPIYVGNAVNDNGVVTVKNSKKLYLIKEWKNSKGRTMSAPVSEIAISIYGVDSNGVRSENPIAEDVKLTSGNNWRSDITDLIAEADLSKYVSFEAVEAPELGDDYVVSCVFNINQLTGEITVTNKNINATDVTVSVRKQWSDGAAVHVNDSVEVALYRLNKKLDNLNNTTIQNAISGIEPVETVILKHSDDEVTDWAYSWTGLPMSELDGEGNPVENGDSYYYYVFEKSINLSEAGAESKYVTSYSDSSSASNTMYDYTIKNTRNAIVVQKQWVDKDGVTPLPDNEIPNEVKVRIYKNIIPEDEVSVMAVGDSITYGYQTTNDAYPLDLAQALTSAGFKLKDNAVANLGANSAKINEFNTNVQGADVICLLGGTNDVHQGGGIKSADKDTVKKAIKESYAVLIGNLKNNSGKNPIIFLGTIPDFKWLKNSTEATEGGKWWWNYSYSNDAAVLKNWETECKNIISYANEAVREIADADPNIYLVDINEIITDKYLQDDGCHPNAAGWDKIAEAYGKSIKSYYREYLKTDGTFTTDDKDPDIAEFTVDSDGSWTRAIDVPVGDGNGKYVYGVEETDVVDNVWKVSYEDNGQQAASNIPVTVINERNVEKTSIRVHKTWVGDDAAADADKHALLPNNFYLQRRIENSDGTYSEWETVLTDNPTAVSGIKDTWEYIDLPSRDANGNIYYYAVDEIEIDGYSKTPAEPTGFEAGTDGTSAGTVEITNTRQLSISVNKTWSDGNDAHLKDSVTFQLYRSTEIPADIADKLELKLSLPENILVTVDNITEITANKSGISIDKSGLDENIASVEVNGNIIRINGISAGETSVVVTDGKTTETLDITVSSLMVSVEGAEFADGYYKITADTEYTFNVTDNGNDVNDAVFSCSNNNIIVDGKKFTAKALGDYTITVEANGLKVPINIRVVLPDDFEITGGDTVNIGETLELGINPDYGNVIWSSSDVNIAEVDSNGVVIPHTSGKVTITANREGKIKTKIITVVEKITINAGEQANISDGGKAIKNVAFTFSGDAWSEVNPIKFMSDSNAKYQAKIGFYNKNSNNNNIYMEIAASSSDINSVIKTDFTNADDVYSSSYKFPAKEIAFEFSKDDNITSIEFKSDKMNVEYVVSYYDETASENYMRRSARFYSASAYAKQADPFEAYKVDGKTITFEGGKGDFDKTLTFEDLDVYDENGSPYYYWIAEIDSPNGYIPLYAFKDGDNETIYAINASKPGNSTAEIYNYREIPEGVKMPSTGGTGTEPYHVTGILIISGSLLGIIYYRRRRRKTA